MIHTLRGVFPEPKTTPKRNFIKENVKHIKRMQGLLQNSSDTLGRTKDDKYQTVPPSAVSTNVPKVRSRQSKGSVNNQLSQSAKSLQKFTKKDLSLSSPIKCMKLKEKQNQAGDKTWNRLNCGSADDCNEREMEKVTSRSVQTEPTTDIAELYQTGVIKYPSPYIIRMSCKKSQKKGQSLSPMVHCDRGDSPNQTGNLSNRDNDICNELGQLRVGEKHDFIKENALAVKQKTTKLSNTRDPTVPPPDYKKGVVPKYIQERKEELLGADVVGDLDCPEGHILLPEDERKETLRVLRQSYADRVQELNGMPVRTDTLRQRKRKMEIEEELKKIDEGIKVFQRPKVFVKINT